MVSRADAERFKPVILITGGSSGIGLSLARTFWDNHKFRVIVTARKESMTRFKTQAFHETDRFWLRSLDVTSEEDRKALFKEIAEKWEGVDILINNAGISYRSTVEHMDEQSELKQMATNYLGPMALIRAALPHMRQQGRGKIINISSVSGMLAMPTMGSYSASKFALEGASESLWYEMKPLGINVTLIQPGFIRSNAFGHVYKSPKAQLCDIRGNDGTPYCDYYAAMEPFVKKMMDSSWSTTRTIANVIYKVIEMEDPPLRIPATWDASIFHLLRRFLPRRFFHFLLFNLLPGARGWARAYTKARH